MLTQKGEKQKHKVTQYCMTIRRRTLKINLNNKVTTRKEREEKKEKIRTDSRENTVLKALCKALCKVSDQK